MQLFPFRTLAMVISGLSLIFLSMFSRWVFETGRLPPKYDFLRCVINIPDDVQKVGDPQEGEMSVMACHTVVKYNATDEMNGRVNPALTLGSDSDEDMPAPTTTTADGKIKKRLVGEIISPPAVTSPKKHDQTKL